MSRISGNLPATLPALALALLPVACLREAPYTSPDRVYDVREALARSHLDGLDSVAILLVSVEDSARTRMLWSGHPDEAGRMPVHFAGEGERFYFEVRGWRDGLGHCRTETIRDGESFVVKDACGLAPGADLEDGPIDFGDTSASRSLAIRAVNGFQGQVELRPRQEWLRADPDTFLLSAGSAGISATLAAARAVLWPGVHDGVVDLWGNGVKLDSVAVRATSRSIEVFQQDSLVIQGRVNIFASVYVRQPLGVPLAALVPRSPAWLKVEPGSGTLNVGGVKSLNLTADFTQLPEGRTSLTLRAVDPLGRPIDSLRVHADRTPGRPTFPLGGRVVDWRTGAALAGVPVELFDYSAGLVDSAVSASDGSFAFSGLDSGNYRVEAFPPGRVGGMDQDVLPPGGSVTVGIPPADPFRTLEVPGAPAGFGPMALAGGRLVAAGRGAAGTFVIADLAGGTAPRILAPPAGIGRGGYAPFEALAVTLVPAEKAYYFSYPRDSMLVFVRGFPANPVAQAMKVGFEPFGMAADGEDVVVVGRRGDRLLVQRFHANSRAIEDVDTLPAALGGAALAWTGPADGREGPRVRAEGEGRYTVLAGHVDGLPAAAVRLDGFTGEARLLVLDPPAAFGLHDANRGPAMFFTSPDGIHHELDAWFRQPEPFPDADPAYGIHFCQGKTLPGYGFSVSEHGDLMVLMLHPNRVMGRLALPGGLRARELAVDEENALFAVGDGLRIHWMDWR